MKINLKRLSIEKILTHPLVAVLTIPIAWMLWSLGGSEIILGITTNYCAVAFTYWTILVFLQFLVKIPSIAFILWAFFFAFMGTLTLAVYRPFFSFPTVIHLLEAIFGYGYLIGWWFKRGT